MSMDFRGDPASASWKFSTRAELHLPGPLHRHRFRPLPGHVHRHRQQPRSHRPPAHRPHGIIRIHGYTEDEKVQIAKRFLWPKQLKAHGLTARNLEISDPAFQKLIDDYHPGGGRPQPGARADRGLPQGRQAGRPEGPRPPRKGQRQEPGRLSGRAKFRRSPWTARTRSAWPSAWPGPVRRRAADVRSHQVHGKGGFVLTGQLGEVMQESAQTAFSYVRSKIFELKRGQDVTRTSTSISMSPKGPSPRKGLRPGSPSPSPSSRSDRDPGQQKIVDERGDHPGAARSCPSRHQREACWPPTEKASGSHPAPGQPVPISRTLPKNIAQTNEDPPGRDHGRRPQARPDQGNADISKPVKPGAGGGEAPRAPNLHRTLTRRIPCPTKDRAAIDAAPSPTTPHRGPKSA